MKKISLFAIFALLPFMADASDSSESNNTLTLSVRRIGLEWSKTDVKNAAEYQDSPVSALKADSQDFIKAVFDTALVYNTDRFQ